MQLTPSQSRAVDKLEEAYNYRGVNKNAYFKAPTGSGKTFMASELISRILEDSVSSGIKTIVIVATISNAELPASFAKKLKNYKNSHAFKNYTIEHIKSPSDSKVKNSVLIEEVPDLKIEENTVFVFGKASFGKNTKFYEKGLLNNFFEGARDEYEIVYIRDEAHIGGGKRMSKDEGKKFDEFISDNSSFVVEMTATPKSAVNLVELKKQDMSDDGVFLLKSNEKKSNLVGEISNEEIIDDAIKNFKKSQKDYSKLDELINPAMLIQVMNDSEVSKEDSQRFKDSINLLERKLTEAGLSYLKYFSNNDKTVVNTNAPATLDYASRNDSLIDVIIFKVGPATGWDIPRANFLLQIRNISSEALNTQTIGRIMRNPIDGLKFNSITDNYYLYSNFQKPTRDDASYKLKDNFKNLELYRGYVNQEDKEFKENLIISKKNIITLLESEDFSNFINDLTFSEIVYDYSKYGQAKIANKIENIFYLKSFNIKKSREYKNIINISEFESVLSMVSRNTDKNIEVVKYCLWKFIGDIREIKNESFTWIHGKTPYHIESSGKLMENYNIWIDNKDPKIVNSYDDFGEVYGYELISLTENVQYLDSTPELMFYEKFKNILSSDQKEKIQFFAKMPTLGSGVWFEYYSDTDAAIKRSFMDFAIKLEDKVIMVEVKSKEKDYNPKKTESLKIAYSKYIESSSNKISLVLYQHDDTKPLLSGILENKWIENLSFRDLFDKLIK